MLKAPTSNLFRRGFTIVELLIVIVVIGVLAAISFIAYSGIQHSATESAVKDTLSKAVKAMELEKIQTGSFNTVFPDNIKVGSGIGIALTEVDNDQVLCINATSKKYDDIMWHVDESGTIVEGLCDGKVITASITGNYNSAAGPQAEPSYSIANGDGGGFVVQTADDWSTLTLTWDAVPDTSRYEIQSRTSTTGNESTWRLSSIASGGGNYGVTGNQNNTSLSAQIPPSTTSITWDNATYMMPQSLGDAFQYRIRAYNSSNVAGSWNTATLTTPTVGTRETVKSMTATPAIDWSNINLTWVPPNTNNVPQPRYEIQSRTSTTGDESTWRLSSIASGGGNYPVSAQNQNNTTLSAQIPFATNSITWNNTAYMMPQSAGSTYQYRIRIKSNIVKNLFSDWVVVNLSTPDVTGAQNMASSFTATPSGDWSTITFSWTPPMINEAPQPRYELQSRTSDSGTWRLSSIASGGGNYTVTPQTQNSTLYSAQIPYSDNSITWNNTTYMGPQTSGQTYQYRIRIKTNIISNLYSDWLQIDLSR